jgi:hypothetical protein
MQTLNPAQVEAIVEKTKAFLEGIEDSKISQDIELTYLQEFKDELEGIIQEVEQESEDTPEGEETGEDA